MRAHQISPKNAKSIRRPLSLIVVPVRCACIAPVQSDRHWNARDTLAVKVNGLLIEDADIKVGNHQIEDGRYAEIQFSGTVAVFAPDILSGVQAARLPQIEFIGWIEGQARELQIEIIGEVVMATPVDGKVYSLVGADR